MNTKVLLSLMLIIAAATQVFASDNAEYARVLVFDRGTKPAAAMANARYELRRVTKNDASMMCDACLQKAYPDKSLKPAAAAAIVMRNEAYLCVSCGNMCWRSEGVETKFEEKKQCDACEQIKRELSAPAKIESAHEAASYSRVDTTTKPSVQNMQRRNRQ